MTMTTAIKGMAEMTSEALANLLSDTDHAIRKQERMMARTPRDTVAYAAMVASRPGLISFRNAVDAELGRRGL